MKNDVYIDFDFSAYKKDVTEQKHIPSEVYIYGLFIGQITFKINGVNFGSYDNLFETVAQLMKLLEQMLYFREEKVIHSYLESSYYICFMNEGNGAIKVIGSPEKDLLGVNPSEIAYCHITDILGALGDFYSKLIKKSVELHPGLYSREDFIYKKRYVANILKLVP